jgi:hypothetical protein
MGKNTPGYARYTELVPRAKRRQSQPHTPDVHRNCPKRQWDARIREWRRALHRWDPEELRAQAARDAVPPACEAAAPTVTPSDGVSAPEPGEAAAPVADTVKESIYGSFVE